MTLARDRNASRWVLPASLLRLFAAMMPQIPLSGPMYGSTEWLLERRERRTPAPCYNPYPRCPYALTQRRRKAQRASAGHARISQRVQSA